MLAKRKIREADSGFGTIEVIVAVCVLLALGFVSFYFWHKAHQKPNATTQKQSQQSSSKVTESKLADLPADLRDFIISDAKTTNPQCSADIQNNSFVKTDGTVQTTSVPVISYSANDLAYAVIGCSGSDTTTLYAKEMGIWKKVDQYGDGGAFRCSVLEQYKPPIKLLRGQDTRICTFDQNNSKLGTYDGHSVTNLGSPLIGQ